MKKRLSIFVIYILIILMVSIFSSCSDCVPDSTEVETRTDNDTFIFNETFKEHIDDTKSENPTINEIASKLYVGQTYAEVCEVIGVEGKDIGSGEMICIWEFEQGEKITIVFDVGTKKDTSTIRSFSVS